MEYYSDIQIEKEKFANVIKKIIYMCGSEIINENTRFLNIFYDLAPKMIREHKILKRIIEEKQLSRFYSIATADSEFQEEMIKAFETDLNIEAGLSKEWIEIGIDAFCLALKIPLMKRTNITQINKNILTQNSINNGISPSSSGSSMLKRGRIALEVKDFSKAAQYFDATLNMNSEESSAYFGLFMCENHCSTIEELQGKLLKEYLNANSAKSFKTVIKMDMGDIIYKAVGQAEWGYPYCTGRFEEYLNAKYNNFFYFSILEFWINRLKTDKNAIFQKSNNWKLAAKFDPDLNQLQNDIVNCINKAIEEEIEKEKKINNKKKNDIEIKQDILKSDITQFIQDQLDFLEPEFKRLKGLLAKYKEEYSNNRNLKTKKRYELGNLINETSEELASIQDEKVFIYELDTRSYVVKDMIASGNYPKTVRFGKSINNEGYSKYMEWHVILLNPSRLLLVNKDFIDNKEYLTTASYISKVRTNPNWDNSDIRHWLNNDFLYNCFTNKERVMIALDDIITNHYTHDMSGKILIKSSIRTADKIFLLDAEQVEQYRIEDLVFSDKTGWWLRSISDYGRACSVRNNRVDYSGDEMHMKKKILPALYIKW